MYGCENLQVAAAMMAADERYFRVAAERQRYVDAIVQSPSRHKIVVAGPGTGKTYLFKTILTGKTRTLTLTFVNSLVEDLALELYGISDVKTFHGYARSALSTATGNPVKVFPKLTHVISEDANVILGETVDFERVFHTMEHDMAAISFYKSRKDYYDKYYGYSDIIYALVKYFEGHQNKIPEYQQVVVDEFQDFNKSEVALIELLAEKSPVLVAGDDDQALYGFKHASPEHIRHKHGDDCPEFASFVLPFCSRCCRVVVEAANDVVAGAQENGLLSGRIEKPYKYFEDEAKDKQSQRHPKLDYFQTHAGKIPWLIEKCIDEIALELKKPFGVLVITPFGVQARRIVRGLHNRGFQNIEYIQRSDGNEVTLLDGCRLLMEDPKSNLGWRVAAKWFMEPDAFSDLVIRSSQAPEPFVNLVDRQTKSEIKRMVQLCKKSLSKKACDEECLDALLRKTGVEPQGIVEEYLKKALEPESRLSNPALRKVRIRVTTVQSSKGLAEDYVFIANCDDEYLVKAQDKSDIADQDVCNFLVALTRARLGVALISSNVNREPAFVQWIDQCRLSKTKV